MIATENFLDDFQKAFFFVDKITKYFSGYQFSFCLAHDGNIVDFPLLLGEIQSALLQMTILR
jgi:hypothetical protein